MAWTPRVADSVIDSGLTSMKTAATSIYICQSGMSASTNPSGTEVSSTYKAGVKYLGAGAVIPGAIAASGTDGRKVTTQALTGATEGTVSATATASYWAVTNGTVAGNDATVVYAVGNLSTPQAVTSGNTFTLGAFDITIKFQ